MRRRLRRRRFSRAIARWQRLPSIAATARHFDRRSARRTSVRTRFEPAVQRLVRRPELASAHRDSGSSADSAGFGQRATRRFVTRCSPCVRLRPRSLPATAAQHDARAPPAWRLARSARPGRYRRRCRRAAAPYGRCRPASRRGPRFKASSRASSRPASERLRKPSSGRAASLAPMNMPSRAKAAIGVSTPWTSRCSRSTSGMVRPVGMPAAVIRMPWLPSGNSSREQAQVASMPGAAPKPRSRSSRTAPFGGRRPASRAICRRC